MTHHLQYGTLLPFSLPRQGKRIAFVMRVMLAPNFHYSGLDNVEPRARNSRFKLSMADGTPLQITFAIPGTWRSHPHYLLRMFLFITQNFPLDYGTSLPSDGDVHLKNLCGFS